MNTVHCKYCLSLGLEWSSQKEHDSETDHMGEVLPGLFIGMNIHSTSYPELKASNIGHVISMAFECKPSKYHLCKTFYVPLHDSDGEYALDAFKQAAKIIDSIFNDNSSTGNGSGSNSNGNGNVLVHCQLGKSRSVGAVIAYLILYKGFSFDDGYAAVRRVRPFARLNPAYIQQLRSLALE